MPHNKGSIWFAIAIAGAALDGGCATSGHQGFAQDAAAGGPNTDSSAAADGIPGYVHTLERSRFSVGAAMHVVTDSKMMKIVGDKGVFATEVASEATTAISDQVVPPLDPAMAFQGGEDAQNAAVEAYFVSAGLPKDQLMSVRADSTGIIGMGGWSDQLVTAAFSVLSRGFEGVRILDSKAWAILGADGSSLEESVCWPALDQNIVDQLRHFHGVLSDPMRAAAFRSSLPAEYRDGELVIHHTGPFWTGALVAVPCFNGSSGATPVCFDESGHLVELPDSNSNN